MKQALPLRRLAIKVAYDGTAYAGFQRQASHPTIQGALEKALTKLCDEPITIAGCSRTDAGVHALGHVSSFESHTRIPVDKLPVALATQLPPDIVCLEACEVADDFHARFSAKGKQYAYTIWNSPLALPLFHRYGYHEARPLQVEAMQACADLLVGEHDFSAFQAAGSPSSSQIRRLYSIQIGRLNPEAVLPIGESFEPLSASVHRRWDPIYTNQSRDVRCLFPSSLEREQGHLGLLRIVVHGSGFLYNMMRILAGTLLYVGLGKLELEQVQRALQTGDRTLTGKTLPPQGLCLERVDYEGDLFR